MNMMPLVIKKDFSWNMKSGRALNSNFSEWVDFAYWWNFNGQGSAINRATQSNFFFTIYCCKNLVQPFAFLHCFNYICTLFSEMMQALQNIFVCGLWSPQENCFAKFSNNKNLKKFSKTFWENEMVFPDKKNLISE